MRKTTTKNFWSLVVAITCAIAIYAVLTKSGPSAAIAVLSTIITALSLQLAFLRRDLSVLKEQVINEHKQ